MNATSYTVLARGYRFLLRKGWHGLRAVKPTEACVGDILPTWRGGPSGSRVVQVTKDANGETVLTWAYDHQIGGR